MCAFCDLAIENSTRLWQWLTLSRQEYEYRSQLVHRERLTDNDIALRYFAQCPNVMIPITVIRVLRKQLEVEQIRPGDNLAAAFPDVPFDEIVRAVFEELRLAENLPEIASLDGTVGDLVNKATACLESSAKSARPEAQP